MDAAMFFIAFPGSNESALDIPYAVEDGEFYAIPSLPSARSVTGVVIARGTPLLFRTSAEYRLYVDANGLTRVPLGNRSKPASASQMFVPLDTGHDTIGCLSIQSRREYAYTQTDLQVLCVVASQVAAAIEYANLYWAERQRVGELHAEAITEPLTHLYNRRYLMERFREERSRALRTGHDLVAIMLDIDKFKQVNDTHGHDAGDVVLRDLGRVIREMVRAEDVVSRYGGDEFCLLLPAIPVADAENVADRLRHSIERHELPQGAGVRHVTVSIGLARLEATDRDTELFSRADRVMYEVKRAGRNGVGVLVDGEQRLYTATRGSGADRLRYDASQERTDRHGRDQCGRGAGH